MRFPKLPGRSAADEATPNEAPTAPQQHTNIISAVPMPEHTPPPLTSELTRSIRFTISEPQGYYFEQVETFVQQVIDVLAFYEAADDRWRQYAYEMQLEVDQQAYDAQRLRSEIELFKVQGSPLVNPDGSYMTESQNSTLAAVSADLNLVKDQLSASEQSRLVGQEEINRLQDLAAMRDQEIASLRAWGEQVIADMQALQTHAANLEAELAAAQAAQAAAPSAQAVAVAPVASVEAPAAAVPVIEPVIEPVVGPVVTPVAVPVVEVPVVDVPNVEVPVAEVPVVEVPVVEVPVAVAPVEVATAVAADSLDPQVPLVDLPAVHVESADGDASAVPEVQMYVPAEHTTPAPGPESSLYVPPTAFAEAPVVDVPVYDPEALTLAPALTPTPVPVQHSPADSPTGAAPVSEVPLVDVALAVVPTVNVPVVEVPVDEMPVIDVAASDFDDYDEDDYDAEGEDEDASDGWDLDSELPEGVSLPGTGEAAYSYPTAAPGAPLETHGVPMGVWAPELDPRITEALAEEARQQAPATPAAEPTN